MAASDTWVVKPNLVNSLTFGYQTDLQHAGEPELGVKPLTGDVADQLLGLQGVNSGGYQVPRVSDHECLGSFDLVHGRRRREQ